MTTREPTGTAQCWRETPNRSGRHCPGRTGARRSGRHNPRRLPRLRGSRPGRGGPTTSDWKTWYQNQDATDIRDRADEKTKEWKNETQARWSDGVVTEVGWPRPGTKPRHDLLAQTLQRHRPSERTPHLPAGERPQRRRTVPGRGPGPERPRRSPRQDGGGDNQDSQLAPRAQRIRRQRRQRTDALKDLATAFRLPPEWRYGGHPVEDYRGGGHDRKEKVDALLVREAEGQYITVERMEADLQDLHEARDFLAEKRRRRPDRPGKNHGRRPAEELHRINQGDAGHHGREAELTNMPGVVRHVGNGMPPAGSGQQIGKPWSTSPAAATKAASEG